MSSFHPPHFFACENAKRDDEEQDLIGESENFSSTDVGGGGGESCSSCAWNCVSLADDDVSGAGRFLSQVEENEWEETDVYM